jgi:streptogramin lyase
MNPSLWLVDAQGDNSGQNRTNLSLSTWASKCTFASNSEVYCAVPKNLPEGSGLFPELADKTSDLLYKIDTVTGSKKLIAIPENASNISNIMVASDQKVLYFTDQLTGQIYSIQLK